MRLYVILDTSVLLSHWSFIQALHRNLGQDGAVAPTHPGSPEVQLLLVVPWAVLVELDKLKEEHSVLRIQGKDTPAHSLPALPPPLQAPLPLPSKTPLPLPAGLAPSPFHMLMLSIDNIRVCPK